MTAQPCWAWFRISMLRTSTIRRFFMPALVWARTRWKPYKNTIDRWLWPDVFRRQDTSVSKAKQAISKYKKALGDPEGVAELMVFYCERAAGFCTDVGHEDAGYFDALVRMFEQALKTTNILAPSTRIAPARGKPSSPARLSLQSAMTATTLFPNIVRGYVVAEHNPVRSSKPARPLVACRWLSIDQVNHRSVSPIRIIKIQKLWIEIRSGTFTGFMPAII